MRARRARPLSDTIVWFKMSEARGPNHRPGGYSLGDTKILRYRAATWSLLCERSLSNKKGIEYYCKPPKPWLG
jgi:hypothetical protein